MTTSPPTQDALEPCPFCGGHSLEAHDHDDGTPTVWFVCKTCGAHGPFDDYLGNAEAAWNRRALATPQGFTIFPHPEPTVEALSDNGDVARAQLATAWIGAIPEYWKSTALATAHAHVATLAQDLAEALATPINGADREVLARIIDPSSWRVLDSYLAEAKRKYKGQDAGYDPEAFKDRASLTKADACLRALASRGGGAGVPSAIDVEVILQRIFDAGHFYAKAKFGEAELPVATTMRARQQILDLFAASPPIPVQGGGEEP